MHGRLRLDTVGRRRLSTTRQPVELSARELAVLELLLMREGRVVSKEHMVNHLYGWGDEVGANAIEVYVYRIRKKLEPLGCEIRTVRGMGYLMERDDGPAEPRLQRKLLAWLLGPLLALLVLDTAVVLLDLAEISPTRRTTARCRRSRAKWCCTCSPTASGPDSRCRRRSNASC